MTPSFYDFLLQLTLPLLVLCLVLLPFLPASSPELFITIVSTAIAGTVAALCAYKRRSRSRSRDHVSKGLDSC